MATAAEIQAELEELHAGLNKELNAAIIERTRAEQRVAHARQAIAEAPRLHVKRKVKKKAAGVTVEGMTKVLTALNESLKADEGDGTVTTLPELRIGGGE